MQQGETIERLDVAGIVDAKATANTYAENVSNETTEPPGNDT
jgi:hypothetical protein